MWPTRRLGEQSIHSTAAQACQFCICFPAANIYIYAFSRRFYPKRLTTTFRLYIFISKCVPWESNPQPFALLTQCSTTEPHRRRFRSPLKRIKQRYFWTKCNFAHCVYILASSSCLYKIYIINKVFTEPPQYVPVLAPLSGHFSLKLQRNMQ